MTTQHPTPPDLLAVLAAVRPDPDADRGWSLQDQAAVRARIMTDTSRPADELAARRGRRRVVALVTVGLLLTGGGAVAGGLVPQAFTDRFPYWADGGPSQPSVDPADAERVATAPGPDGLVFSLVVARADSDPDHHCTVAVFETAESAVRPGPSEFTDVSNNSCHSGPESTGPFGAGDVVWADGYWVWDAPSGDAVRAELRTSAGETYPVVSYGGSFYGWFPALGQDEPREAELIGYAADGTEVGRIQL
ncbi:hypothetical protein [Goekera deserti]|uniref:Uncharacterized protein n=1 Tax=Goekera deserti TaxID=2497753 RepID=A0A7K3WG42_9ACTN|nr:hypothetical protein [Goekera deserti]NDI50408.1 hypothetical protein [Goekera deserti]NEL55326.1 hypothetical protein [Goekera deserti]